MFEMTLTNHTTQPLPPSKIPKPTITRHTQQPNKEAIKSHSNISSQGTSGSTQKQERDLANKENAWSGSKTGWKTVKPNVTLANSDGRDYNIKNIHERLENQDAKILELEKSRKFYDEQQAHYKERLERVNKQIEQLDEDIKVAERETEDLKHQYVTVEKQLKTAMDETKQQQTALDDLEIEKTRLQGLVQVGQAKTHSLQTRIDEQKDFINSMHQERLSLQRQIQEEKSQYQTLKQKMEESQRLQAELERKIDYMQKLHMENSTKLEDETLKIKTQTEHLKELQQKCAKQEDVMKQHNEEKLLLEERLAQLNLTEEEFPCRKESLEKEIVQLKDTVSSQEDNLRELEAYKETLETELRFNTTKLQEIQQEYDKHVDENSQQVTQLERQIEKLEDEIHSTQELMEKSKQETVTFKTFMEQQQTLLVSLANKLSCLELQLEEERNIKLLEKQKVESLEERVHRQKHIIDEMEEQSNSDTKVQEELQNKVYEMRPNIQVFCQLCEHVEQHQEKSYLLLQPQDETVLAAQQVEENEKRLVSTFEFDHVFPTNATLQDVFKHSVSFVDQVWNQRNVLVFGYSENYQPRKVFFGKEGLVSISINHLLSTQQQPFPLFVTFFRVWNDHLEDLIALEHRDNMSEKSHSTFEALTCMQLSNLEQVMEAIETILDHEVLFSQDGHLVFRIEESNSSSEESSSLSKLTFIHLQVPHEPSQSSQQRNSNHEKNFVCLLRLLTQLANQEISSSFRESLLTTYLIEDLKRNPKILSIIQLFQSTDKIHSALKLLHLAQKLNCCDLSFSSSGHIKK